MDLCSPKRRQANVVFQTGNKVVYPGHGVGYIVGSEVREVLGAAEQFYRINIYDSGLTILVPKHAASTVGLRPIISRECALGVINILNSPAVALKSTATDLHSLVTWNRRYRDYMDKIKTGEAWEIAQVLRDLYYLKVEKELSFGERKMLDNARSLLLRELSLAAGPENIKRCKALGV